LKGVIQEESNTVAGRNQRQSGGNAGGLGENTLFSRERDMKMKDYGLGKGVTGLIDGVFWTGEGKPPLNV